MDEATAFLRSIVATPEDETLRLSFADWLEERGRWLNGTKPGSAGCGHDYPQHHRLCDVRLRGKPFRVTRCMNCNGMLQVFRITDSAWSPRSGVPLWLQGQALQRWIEDELATESTDEPADRPSDWERYRR
jgi:uncharacterized protein (TIGR02996 family)